MAELYRADHVGSLLRPAALLEARAAHAAGHIGMAQRRDIEDKAILEVLEMQRQVGIDICTDGEYRRSWWSGAIAESVEGVIQEPDAVVTPGWQGPSGSQDQLLRRIDEATQYVPIECLALSPQCGFASTAPGNLLTWDQQRRKLELVVETARKVWDA